MIVNNSSKPNISSICTSCTTEVKKYTEKCDKIIHKQWLHAIKAKKKMKALKSKIRMLENQINNDKYKKALKSVFTDDQIKALLAKKHNVRSWSEDTIHRGLRLKFICGANGYEELIRQGIPLPNLRTLRRKLKF